MTERLAEKALREAMAELQKLVIVIWRSQDCRPHPDDLRVVVTPSMDAWPDRIGSILSRGAHALRAERRQRARAATKKIGPVSGSGEEPTV